MNTWHSHVLTCSQYQTRWIAPSRLLYSDLCLSLTRVSTLSIHAAATGKARTPKVLPLTTRCPGTLFSSLNTIAYSPRWLKYTSRASLLLKVGLIGLNPWSKRSIGCTTTELNQTRSRTLHDSTVYFASIVRLHGFPCRQVKAWSRLSRQHAGWQYFTGNTLAVE
jgi:hypothetical protein